MNAERLPRRGASRGDSHKSERVLCKKCNAGRPPRIDCLTERGVLRQRPVCGDADLVSARRQLTPQRTPGPAKQSFNPQSDAKDNSYLRKRNLDRLLIDGISASRGEPVIGRPPNPADIWAACDSLLATN